MLWHNNSIERSKEGSLSDPQNPTTIYYLGLTLKKDRVTFIGNIFAVGRDTLTPEPDHIFRPSADLMINTLNAGPVSLNLTGSYFPNWEKQDDYGTLGVNLALSERLKFRSGNLSIFASLNTEADIGRSTQFSQDLATIGLSEASLLKQAEREVLTRRVESDIIVGFQPRGIRDLTLQASAHAARSYSKPYDFNKNSQNFIQKKTETPVWNYSFVRAGFTYRLTERLSVMEQLRYYRYDGFLEEAEDSLMIQNRIYLLYTLF
jgi:hypothetical protein